MRAQMSGMGGITMSPAALSYIPDKLRTLTRRDRSVAMILTLVVEALFLLAFFLPVAFGPRKKEAELTTITVMPPGPVAPVAQRAAQKQKTTSEAEPPPPETKPKPDPPAPPSFIELSRSDFAASDISKLSSARPDGNAKGTTAKSAYGPGEGPGGAPLYNAEWYVEPTAAQVAFYLPDGKRPRPGWAMIVCQTLPRYRVDNCRGLGESPPGSGLASALRQAAWQFKVIPPRIGGEPVIGAWVRIRFDWIEGKED